ncbi:MAG: FeoA domain-containing protein [Pirellulaceae bacterium]
MHDIIPLWMLRPGQRARIDQLMGQDDDVHRLQELGMRIGSNIEMVQAGTPCIVKLDGSQLCFRGGEATSVLVRLGEVA